MKYLLVLPILFFLNTSQGAIYDCFLFFNEVELLKIHLAELYDKVDHFVIVEGEETFSGISKEYRLLSALEGCREYADKVIYVQAGIQKNAKNAWDRESFQRNAIMRGLIGCKPDDIIILGDLDEIVKGDLLEEVIAELQKKEHLSIGCGCDFYRWCFNWKETTHPWVGPIVTFFSYLQKSSPEELRGTRWLFSLPCTAWHFSNMGGPELFKQKIQSFSHFEECVDNIPLIERAPIEYYNSLRNALLVVPIDESYPRYIQDRIDYYLEHQFIDQTGYILVPGE